MLKEYFRSLHDEEPDVKEFCCPASVMERYDCSDDGFIDFRAWLVGQGRNVYMTALKDPGSLAEAPNHKNCQCDSLPHMM